MMTAITDQAIDELFAPKQLQLLPTERAHCTCRICERVGQRAAEGHQVCANCARNPTYTREHIATTMASYARRVEETWGVLQQSLPESQYVMPDGRYASELSDIELPSAPLVATDPLRKRWDGFHQAAAVGDPAARQAELKARNGMPGPLADLIRLWLAYKDASAVLAEREAWQQRAELALGIYVDDL